MSHSIDDETRRLRSETFSTGIESLSSYSGAGPIYEASSGSMQKTTPSNFSGSDLYTSPVCLTNTNDFNANISSAWDFNAPAFSRPEDMFTPYVPILSNIDNERHHEMNESSGLY
ncbi:unnamed protein product [Rotaria sp. Silwood2]|nr:unnamed protein product [Rotaria sp. Silwood2]